MTTPTNSAPTTATRTAVWPCLNFTDARAAVAFLTSTLGFEDAVLYAREDDPSFIEHGQLRWPLGGGIMFSSIGKGDNPFCERGPGTDSIYLVCENPDALHDRAVAAGAEVVRGLRDEDYGSRGFTVRDPEGNLWSFGTYWGE